MPPLRGDRQGAGERPAGPRRRAGEVRCGAGSRRPPPGFPPAAEVALGMNGFAPEEVTQRGADPAAAATAVVVGNAGSAVEVPTLPAPPGLGPAAAAGLAGAGGAGGPGAGQLCCLREEGERCGRAAGNASFSKRIQKSISQKKVKIELDKSVSLGKGDTHTGPPPPFAAGWASRQKRTTGPGGAFPGSGGGSGLSPLHAGRLLPWLGWFWGF